MSWPQQIGVPPRLTRGDIKRAEDRARGALPGQEGNTRFPWWYHSQMPPDYLGPPCRTIRVVPRMRSPAYVKRPPSAEEKERIPAAGFFASTGLGRGYSAGEV